VEDAGQIDRVSREGYDEKSEMELGSVVDRRREVVI